MSETCGQCRKAISDEEYVVNWGSCAPCFDAGYEDYLRSQSETPRDACRVCGTPITSCELCMSCAEGNDPFFTSKYSECAR